MWVTRYKVHCGRTLADWLRWMTKEMTGNAPYFSGGSNKKCATIFKTRAQAEGAIKKHMATWPGQNKKLYSIHEVKVNEKKS